MIIRKNVNIEAIGLVIPVWSIQTIQAEFATSVLTVVVGGWLTEDALLTNKAPVYTFTLQFSQQMVQQFRRDYFISLENGAIQDETVPDFEALNFDATPEAFTYTYVLDKVTAHPLFTHAVAPEEN